MRNLEANPGKIYFVIGTLLVGSIILGSFKVYGYEHTWKLWQVPTMMPPFADLRLIPGGAETFRRGLDPTIENPGDPYGRIFNYPRIWYLFFYTGIDQGDVIWLGVVMFALFYIGLISFSGKLNRVGVILMLLITFSPAAMLLYERGNVDLLIFFICAMAILVIDYSTWGAALIILLGAILKIFPLFGLGIFIEKNWRHFYRKIILVLFGFGIYAWLTFSNIQASWNTTMRGKTISYGVNILFDRYQNNLLTSMENFLPGLANDNFLDMFPYLLGLTLLIVAMVIGLKSMPKNSENVRNISAFRMGSFIYIGTFLLGNNWDYRLTFLLFTIPQLADWVRSGKDKQRFLVLVTIGLIIISCWHFILAHWFSLVFPDSEAMLIFDEIVNWGLFAVLVIILAQSKPDWVRKIVRNPA